MASQPRTVAIILAGGTGSRMGGDPKQYWMLGYQAVVAHSYRRLIAHPLVSDVLLIIGDGQQAMLDAALGDVPRIVGGASRRLSVRAGLEQVAQSGGAHRVLIHDAARPLLPAAVIDRLLGALDDRAGAVPTLVVADTLAHGRLGERPNGASILLGDVVDRSDLLRVQTPQAFDFDAILAAHRVWPDDQEATDDAQIMRRAGHEVASVHGDLMLDKLTHPDDFAAAEARLGCEWRSAAGFDVHRLEAREELWLGGVLIPHDRGLSGHSDADVALHALTDALLGIIAAGDIGMHFPPSDPQWKGAASHRFLTHAADLIAARGGQIAFVDLTIICEAPKIGPHRAAMQARIADLLHLSPDRVSIKATTTERLGFAGRGEGIAAQAVATVRLPAKMFS